ncbi:MAG: universal stress protein [Cyclobacteriaceae bacterium]
MKRILVPTDFSKEANNAFLAACSLAREVTADILLLHVIEDPHGDSFRTMGVGGYDPMDNVYIIKLVEKTKERLQSIVNDPQFSDINVTYKIDIGNSYSSIIEHISSHKSSLIVMGTKGVSGLEEILVGSVTDKVVRYATCPVITVKHCKNLAGMKNIVFATDLKEDQLSIIEDLKKMQKFYGAKLHIIKVYDSIWLREDEVEKRIKEFADLVQLENYTIEVAKDSDEAEAIMHYAHKIDADMIAMGAHDRHGLMHLIAAHVIKEVINQAHRPIWTKAIR